MPLSKTHNENRRGNGEWCYNQRPNKTWTARRQFGFKANGKPNIKAFYGKTKTEVKNKAKEYERLVGSNPTEIKKETFEEYFSNWMKLYKLGKVKPSTYDSIDFCFECRIKPYTILSQAQLHQITTSLLQQYFNELAKSGKYAYSTIKKTKNTINNCLNKAVVLREIPFNPMMGVELVPEHQLSVKTKSIEFFEDEDIQKIISESFRVTESKYNYKTAKYYRSKNAPIYRYGHHIVLLLQTGIRIGEGLALQWKNVDIANRKIYVETNMTSSYDRDEEGRRLTNSLKEGTTKTKKAVRVIPLSDTAITALNCIRKLNEGFLSDTDKVFLTATSKSPTAKNIRTTLNKMQRNANKKIQNSGLHVLRHSFASMLIRHGVDVKIVSELLGHQKISTTYDIYVSLIDKQKYDAIKTLDLINNIDLGRATTEKS